MKSTLYIITGLVSLTVFLSCADEKIEEEDLLKKRGVEYSPKGDAQIQGIKSKRISINKSDKCFIV